MIEPRKLLIEATTLRIELRGLTDVDHDVIMGPVWFFV